MTVQEAKQILKLDDHFTEEDLKKKYKKEISKWHPDICQLPNAEAMAKKINEAKEVLNDYLKNNSKHTRYQQSYNTSHSNVDYSNTTNAYYSYYKQAYQNKPNFDTYTTTLKNKLYAQYLNIYNDGKLDNITKNTIDMIKVTIKNFELKAKLACKKYDIDTSYLYAQMQIETLIASYILEYCKKNNLDYNITKNIDISKGIAEAYRILKYEKDHNLMNKVEKIVKKPTDFIKNKVKKLF